MFAALLVASVCAAVIINVDPTRRLRVSFLDRLKREAEQQRLQADAVAREREERETLYRRQIEPQMKALAAYLEGLVATLQEVKPPITIPMTINGYGDISLVPFWDYKVEHERRHRGFMIGMTWSMKIDSERAPLVLADGVTRVKALINIFRQYHLGGIKEEKRTLQGDISRATFQARGFVKSRMEAQISAEDPVLRLTFENASWLGSSRRQVPWDQINDSLFDRIARFIVREDDSLFTEELPDALRQRLGKDREPVAPVVKAPAPPEPEARRPEVAAPAPPPPQANVAAVVETMPEVIGAFSQGTIAAPAPMTEGEVIEIDESKLGLADFHEPDGPVSAFALGPIGRAPGKAAPDPAPRVSQAALAQGSPGGTSNIELPPPPKAAPVAASVPAAAGAQLPQATPAVARAATSDDVPVTTPSTDTDAASDPDKERDAALFRLRMRAMLTRLRSDDQEGPKT